MKRWILALFCVAVLGAGLYALQTELVIQRDHSGQAADPLSVFHVPRDGSFHEACANIASGGKIIVTGTIAVSEPASIGNESGAGPSGVTIQFLEGARLLDRCGDSARGALLSIGTPDCTIQDWVAIGSFGPRKCIRAYSKAKRLRISGFEAKNFARHCLDVDGDDTIIEDFAIQRILWRDQETGERQDAHGIVTMNSRGLVLRRGRIGQCSGDAFQAGRGAGWNEITIENCAFFDAPLEEDAGGFRKGERVSENAIDTKTTNHRRTLTVRHSTFYGFGKGTGPGPPALIVNAAAMNLKEMVDATIEHCEVHDCEIGFRLRGTKDGKKLQATIRDCRIENCQVAVRAEDMLDHFTFQGNTLRGCKEFYHKSPGSQAWSYPRWSVSGNIIVDARLVGKSFPIWPRDQRVLGATSMTFPIPLGDESNRIVDQMPGDAK